MYVRHGAKEEKQLVLLAGRREGERLLVVRPLDHVAARQQATSAQGSTKALAAGQTHLSSRWIRLTPGPMDCLAFLRGRAGASAAPCFCPPETLPNSGHSADTRAM